MKGEVISLRRARKERSRAKKRADATANAVLHGRSRAEKALHHARTALEEKKLDGAKREIDAIDSTGEGDGNDD